SLPRDRPGGGRAVRSAEPPRAQLHPSRLARRKRLGEPQERRAGEDARHGPPPDDGRGPGRLPARVGRRAGGPRAGRGDGGRAMTAPCVHLDGEPSGIRVLTLDRPPVNALGVDLVEGITNAAERLAKDEEARCLVVRGAGKHFCAGADLKERQAMSEDEVRQFVPRLAGAVRAVADLPFPTIAAVRGAALGGGCELALACDLRVLSAEATIGLKETALAILPGAGGTQRLTRIAGLARAKRWI